VAICLGAASIVLAGCGGGRDAADTTTIINQTIVSSAATATATSAPSPTASAPQTSSAGQAQAVDGLPQPPAGASQVQTGTENGAAKAKYRISDQLPNQVIEYYTGLWKNDGYTIITSGSGPDGGRKGGATAIASKNGTFVGVEADADAGEPTHFDVCQGSTEAAVRDCID
jgi:hypothetical protein